MAECYQCGNGFGFRGKKINKNEIKKEIQKIIDGHHESLKAKHGHDPKKVKSILEMYKQSSKDDILSNKMSDSDLICEKCFIINLHGNYAIQLQGYNLATLTTDQYMKFRHKYPEFKNNVDKQRNDQLDQMKLEKSKVENNDGSGFSYVCNWCKSNFKESDIQPIDYGYGTYSTTGGECSTCKDVRKKLYSDKLENLLTEHHSNDRKSIELDELIQKARRAKSDARARDFSDGFAGDRTDRITTENRYDDLVMQSNDMALTLSDIGWNISKEMDRLAEEHFFKNKLNNAEDKDNPKTETPLEILKVRLAKGEITLEEFKNIKENLDQ